MHAQFEPFVVPVVKERRLETVQEFVHFSVDANNSQFSVSVLLFWLEMKSIWSSMKAAFATSAVATAVSDTTERCIVERRNIPSVTLKNGFAVKRIINGLWQTAGSSWGVDPNSAETIRGLLSLAQAGFTSFDGADIYGPAELLMGKLRKEYLSIVPPADGDGGSAAGLQLLTKYVPSPGTQNIDTVRSAISKSSARIGVLKSEAVDMIQFHWWDYSMQSEMLNAIDALHTLQQQGMIKCVALTNFDTARMRQFVDRGVPIVSNQVGSRTIFMCQ